MDSADTGKFELAQGKVKSTSLSRRGLASRSFNLAAEMELHLARRLFGEGDGDDPIP